MKTSRSFGLSLFLHAVIIGVIVLFVSIPPQKDEEVVLELALSSASEEPQPMSNNQSIPSTPSSQENEKSNTSEPRVQTPAQPINEASAPETKVQKEPLAAVSSVSTPQTAPATENKPQETSLSPAPPTVNVEEQYLDNHLSAIRDLLVKYRKYPNQAVRQKQEGDVRVSFRLKMNGEVEDITIISSSGYSILDEDAKALIEKTALYFPRPQKSIRITVPMRYSLKTA